MNPFRSQPSILPDEAHKTEAVRTMFDAIAPRYELVNRVMTFGLDTRWRKRCLDSLGIAKGSRVLDLASGTGDLTRSLILRGFDVVSADLSFGMLHAGHDMAATVQADASRLPFDTGSFDGLVCGYALRNFTDLALCVAEMGRIVRPGGRIALLDVAEPKSKLMKTGYDLWFRRCVPVIGGLLSDASAYQYLPESTIYLPEPKSFRALLHEHRFSGVNHHMLSGGLSQLYTATRTS